MTTPNKMFSSRKRSETTGSASSTRENTNRLSFGGSIRLNDLLNDEDDYGFAEEATEASLREYEADGDHSQSPAITNPVEMRVEEPQKMEHMVASSCPSSLSSSVLSTVKKRDSVVTGCRSNAMQEDFDFGLIYSSRERLDELAGPATAPGSTRSPVAVCESSAIAGGDGRECDRGERISLGGVSVGSHDSRDGDNKSSSELSSTGQPSKEKSKGLGAFIDKAKYRLGGSKEREKRSTTNDPSQVAGTTATESKAHKIELSDLAQTNSCRPSSLPIEVNAAREDKLTPMLHLVTHHLTQLPFHQSRLYMGALLVALSMAWPGFIVGLMWGMYISGVAFLFFFVSDPRERQDGDAENTPGRRTGINEACEVFEDTAISSLRLPQETVVFRGWMNELPPITRYDPSNYHVNSCRGVLVRLEGSTLRISRPSRAVLKHAFHTDPTLTATPPSMVAQSIYDLTGATVSLRPRRLARLRWWSRKYPIYIRLTEEMKEGEKRNGKRRKRQEEPRMQRSISMHPSNRIGELSGIGLERVAREEEMRHAETQDDNWITSDSEWEEEARTSTTLGNGFARARSSTEISAVGTENTLDNDSSAYSLRHDERRRKRSIYLFARAAREKERWFHLLREACAKARIARKHVPVDSIDGVTVSRSRSTTAVSEGFDVSPPLTPLDKMERSEIAVGAADHDIGPSATAAREFMLYRANQAHFAKSMSYAMGVSLASIIKMTTASSAAASAASSSGGTGVAPTVAATSTTTPAGVRAAVMMRDSSLDDDTQSVNLGSVRWKPSTLPEGNVDLVASVNAIAGRIFFDFCRDEYWCAQVKEKIQTKLATIHLPYFIENLELSSLDLGTTTPHIESVHAPVCDEWGLWVDFEMKYSGGIRLALETRVNLLKLQSTADEAKDPNETQSTAWARKSNRLATRYSDEDLPESPEDSPDEDFGAKMSTEKENERTGRERAASKIVSLVESAARSSFFQKAAKLSKVAKVITDISSTRLILNVEVEAIEGTMTINLPPPPSDRIWYAFRKRPKVSIRAIPQVGDRSVDLTTVSDWIESKLRLLIEKNLVCPNMDDIIIPAMSGNELLKMNYNR